MTASCLDSNFERLRKLDEDPIILAARERYNPVLTALINARNEFYAFQRSETVQTATQSLGRTVVSCMSQTPVMSELEQQQQSCHSQ